MNYADCALTIIYNGGVPCSEDVISGVFMCTYDYCMLLLLCKQMVQEMEIIINRPDVYKSFALEWKEKWIPAVIMYARKLKRKDVHAILEKCDETDGTSSEGKVPNFH